MVSNRWQSLSLAFLILVFGIVPVAWYYLGGEATSQVILFGFRKSAWFEQLALAGAVGFVKPIYTLLALALVFILRRPKSRQGLALFWGLIFFFAAELACGINIVFYSNRSYSLEFIHGYGMVLNFAFVAYALIETIDARVLNYSDPQKRCTLMGICRSCTKGGGGACALRRGFCFLLAALIILAFIPMMSSYNLISYSTQILKWTYIFSRPLVFQMFDFRLVPIYAVLFLVAAYAVLLAKRENQTGLFKVFLAAGAGSLAFSYLRLIFFDAFGDNLLWSDFWEEFTELVYISGIVFLIWIFDRGYLRLSSEVRKP